VVTHNSGLRYHFKGFRVSGPGLECRVKGLGYHEGLRYLTTVVTHNSGLRYHFKGFRVSYHSGNLPLWYTYHNGLR
jgi:hypothetical protein